MNNNVVVSQKKKSSLPKILLILLVVIIAGGAFYLWNIGYFSTSDSSLNSLENKICNASLQYVEANRDNITDVKVVDKVFYVTVHKLVEKSYLSATVLGYYSGTEIELSTDVRMKVESSTSVKCIGVVGMSAVKDTEAPKLTLNGDSTVTVSVGGTYVDPVGKAIDNIDGDISASISRYGNVDFTKAGTYYIYYVVRDRAGNTSDTLTRTIIVK